MWRKSLARGLCLAALLPGAAGCVPERGDANVDGEALSRLGEVLFFDPALSSSRTVSCATCHDPLHAFADPRRFSLGQDGKPLDRNTPTVLNRPAIGFQFWDGRAISLHNQVVHPLRTPGEMGHSVAGACSRVDETPEYASRFAAAFGSPAVSPERLVTALAAYLETLRTGESDFERAMALGAVAPAVLRGEQLFRGKAGCIDCHTGRDFSDERFHNTGVAWKSGGTDDGRGALTGRDEEMRAFKTPTLRELVRTAPYMHDGSIATLDEVVQHYVDGGAPADPHLDVAMEPLDLGQEEQADLIAFLSALSDSRDSPAYRR